MASPKKQKQPDILKKKMNDLPASDKNQFYTWLLSN
jgi:hypothetical protein